MSSQLELTAKAMVYAVILFMSMIQFGSLGHVCRITPFGTQACSGVHFSAIAFGVIATVPALLLLILFLIKNPMVNQVDAIAAPVLFVFTCIGAALTCTSSLGILTVHAFASVVAFTAVVLLNIYNIMNAAFSIQISATAASEKPAVASEPVPSSANV